MKWIFFDLGWTLIDELEAHRHRFRLLQPFLKAISIEVGWSDFESKCQQAAAAFSPSPFSAALEMLGLSRELHQRAREIAIYDKQLERPYPGISEMLRALSGRYELGIIANQSAGTIDRLKRWGLGQHFSMVFASAEEGLAKPDPRIFERALTHAQCPASDALMVGDRIDNDVSPASRAGWRTARVLQGFSKHQIPRSDAEKPEMTFKAASELHYHL